MIKTYRKTATVDAIQFTGDNDYELREFITCSRSFTESLHTGVKTIIIKTLEGNMVANVGDYICRGSAGEFWPIKKEIFESTYIEV